MIDPKFLNIIKLGSQIVTDEEKRLLPITKRSKSCNNNSCKQKYTSLSFKKCGQCKCALYCSLECQRSDWLLHKLSCTNAHNSIKNNLTSGCVPLPIVESSVRRLWIDQNCRFDVWFLFFATEHSIYFANMLSIPDDPTILLQSDHSHINVFRVITDNNTKSENRILPVKIFYVKHSRMIEYFFSESNLLAI